MTGAVLPGAAAMFFSARGTETAASAVITVSEMSQKICGSCSHKSGHAFPAFLLVGMPLRPDRWLIRVKENAEEKAQGNASSVFLQRSGVQAW